MADDPVDRAVRFTLDNWEALGVEENAGTLHLPAAIKRRTKTGGVSEKKVMLRNVTHAHKFKCRIAARRYAAELELDLDRDKDFIEEIENYSILAFAIREPKSFDQHVATVAELVDLYEAQSLAELWGIYNAWVEMLDPRFGEVSDEQLWKIIARVAREKNITPLLGTPGFEQHSCIVAMASQALLSPNRPSWLQPLETSRRVSSPSLSSAASSG